MKWRIEYSRDADKFIEKQNIRVEVTGELKKFLIKMQGGNVNLNLKKLTGHWAGYYRLRKGKIRVIFEIDKIEKNLFIEKVDFRGDVYK